MSATLDNERLQQALPDAPVIASEGRAFPVERRYQPLPTHQRFDEAVAIATAELLRQEPGSLLLFLPGVGKSSACRNSWQPAWETMWRSARCTVRCR
jgi:ATP-dependent helicase HrpB